MSKAPKIAIEVPAELLERARKASGSGVTQTVRARLHVIAASRDCARPRALREDGSDAIERKALVIGDSFRRLAQHVALDDRLRRYAVRTYVGRPCSLSASCSVPAQSRQKSFSLMGDVIAVLHEFLDPLSRCLDAESAARVLALSIPPSVQERVDTLAERANEGLLSDDERDEYDALINAEDFLAILKLKYAGQLPDALWQWTRRPGYLSEQRLATVANTVFFHRSTLLHASHRAHS